MDALRLARRSRKQRKEERRMNPLMRFCRNVRNVQQESALSRPSVNAVFNDPDFSSRTVRVTDNNTGVPCGLPVNETFFTDSSAEENMWNADTTKFLMDSQDG